MVDAEIENIKLVKENEWIQQLSTKNYTLCVYLRIKAE